MTGPDETASLVGEITRAYREHAAEEAEITAVPGSVLGGDVKGQADPLADAAARLAGLLAAFTQEPRRSLDAIAVFRALSRSAGVDGGRGRRAAPPGVVRPRGRGGPGGRSGVEGRPRWLAVRCEHV